MSEDIDRHGHDDHCCAQPSEAPPSGDPASQSLADALRVSFRLLSIIMVLVVVAFGLTGVKTIESDQEGIIKIFGKIVRTAKEGLVYTWPFPVGDIEIVNIKEQSVLVDDFWMHETPQDKTVELSSRRVMSEGLRPGWDGALLTGDRNLLHVKLKCTYVVRDPVVYAGSVLDADQIIRPALCRAAIHAAAERTADGIQQAEQAQFLADVTRYAQAEVDELLGTTALGQVGIRITHVILAGKGKTWPLKALPAFTAAQNARSHEQKLVDAAIAEAGETLNAAAGASYIKLVGESATITGFGPAGRRQPGLIGQYDKARSAGDETEAARLLEEINNVLLSSATVGQASTIIAKARTYKTDMIQNIKSRAERFALLLPAYEESPTFMLERLWAATREEILSSPVIEKWYLTPTGNKIVVKVNRDPEVAERIQSERLKASDTAAR